DQTITCKIVINPQAEQQVGEPNEIGVLGRCRINVARQVVGQAAFEEETNHDPSSALVNVPWRPFELKSLDLRQQVLPSFDGTRDDLRKKTGKVHKVEKRGQRLPEGQRVDYKRNLLKGVERNADRDQ